MIDIEPKFQGRVITVNVEHVTLPNGRRAALEIVHHPGGAAIVAIDAENRICLLRQFRHAGGGYLWELPAGKLEPNEPPFDTARRELIEEAGVTAQDWRSLGSLLSSPGVFTEVIHLFLARDLSPCDSAHEEHEVIEVHWVPLGEAWDRAVSGEIRDAKTAMGILRARSLLQSGLLPAALQISQDQPQAQTL
jgi:8-oxo-dGTP pyrophosphatase MutT (NUDIX family)